MIPPFEDFLYPFLCALQKEDLNKMQMRIKMIEYFKLTDEDCQQLTKGGSTSQLSDRVGWSLQYLRRAGLVENLKRSYHITQRGKEYLSSNTSLRKSDLMQFPEFAAYSNVRVKKQFEENDFKASELVKDITPTEQMDNAYESINSSLSDDLLAIIKELTPAFFERLVVDLLVAMGYGGDFKNAAMVTQYSKDDGIDGIIKEDKLGLDNIYIQAKRWNSQIGKPQIQQFAGALDEKRASKGVFITTSNYSKDARNYVANLSKKIVLIDGKELANYMIEYGVGVSTKKKYEVKKIDSDYFEE